MILFSKMRRVRMKKTWNPRQCRFRVGDKGRGPRMAALQQVWRMAVQTKVREQREDPRWKHQQKMAFHKFDIIVEKVELLKYLIRASNMRK